MQQRIDGDFRVIFKGIPYFPLFFISKTILKPGDGKRCACVYALHITPFFTIGFNWRTKQDIA